MSIYTDEIFGPVLCVVRVDSYDSALQEEHAALQRELAAAQRVLEAHKRRAEELESRLNAPSEELALAQMENRAFSKTLDALHTEVSRERAAGEKLRDPLKACADFFILP